jgi:hypothetical protein
VNKAAVVADLAAAAPTAVPVVPAATVAVEVEQAGRGEAELVVEPV